MDKTQTALAVLVIAIAGVGGAMFSTESTEAPPSLPIETLPAVSRLTIYVAGAVSNPGLVEVPYGARVADAVASAGGAIPGADLSGLNLASLVIDGQQITVPDDSGPSGLVATQADGRVAVNSAGIAELTGLPGIGPVLAERIVEYRDSYGPFAVVEDLLDVPGIGESKLASLREAIVVP